MVVFIIIQDDREECFAHNAAQMLIVDAYSALFNLILFYFLSAVVVIGAFFGYC